jgi:hypothetical protein
VLFAWYDPAAPQPSRVLGWYDTDFAHYPNLPPEAELLRLTPEQWASRLDTPYVQDGALVEAPPDNSPPPPRIVSGEAFLGLFTDTELDALWNAHVRLRRRAMKVMTQDSANLDSAEAAGLMALAVAKNVLTRARADQVLAGRPPEGNA